MQDLLYSCISDNEVDENGRCLLFIHNEFSINHYNENQETKSASVKL